MEIRIRETGKVVSEIELRMMHPNTSLPVVLNTVTLNDLGADAVLEGPQPEHTEYQYVLRDGVEEIGGQWFTKYQVVDMSQEEVDAIINTRKQANADRARDLLIETDWCENASVRDVTVVPHLMNPADFDTYRLVLRGIVINKPEVVETWPTSPKALWATE